LFCTLLPNGYVLGIHLDTIRIVFLFVILYQLTLYVPQPFGIDLVCV